MWPWEIHPIRYSSEYRVTGELHRICWGYSPEVGSIVALSLTGVECSSWTVTDCWDCDELATVGVVGGFVHLLFPLPFAAMPFSSFSTTTSRACLAAILGLVGFGITAGIDNEVNLLRSSSPYWAWILAQTQSVTLKMTRTRKPKIS